ncbi:uncharacterized protein LODBEIA_P33700 [Lodderomyces beijingensis]|uniref:Anaphase spindle elongation protein 1 n=1 Tax=Lodderomyces beijingensis TaxID=1775926 RepID=A0ABP0ZLW0_9ASCO
MSSTDNIGGIRSPSNVSSRAKIDGAKHQETADVSSQPSHPSHSTPKQNSTLLHCVSQLQHPNNSQDPFFSSLATSEESPTRVFETDHLSDHLKSVEASIGFALSALDTTYNHIGYSSEEISSKKAEIFCKIQQTITGFADNLQREQQTIENECKWLRQQIQFILAMSNDSRGDKSLTLLQKGLVFDNVQQYTDGFKEQVLEKLSSSSFRRGCNLDMGQRYESMTRNIPKLTLLEQRANLNKVFIVALKSFVGKFRVFNSLNLELMEIIDVVGELPLASGLIRSLPCRSDAEAHLSLINDFEDTLVEGETPLNLAPKSTQDGNGVEVFILASPLKMGNVTTKQMDDSRICRLRELNYQLLRIIRSLKITKITPDLILTMKQEIAITKEECERRKLIMIEKAQMCLVCIESLQLQDEQLIELQKANLADFNFPAHLDLNCLHTIAKDPTALGMHDVSISYLSELHMELQKRLDQKQDEWRHYSEKCSYLWSKLGENCEYVENFTTKNNNLSEFAIMNYKMELKRLMIKRSEHIETFISDSRAEIKQLWDKNFYSQEMRMQFEYYNYDADSDSDFDNTSKESILQCHEEEVRRLTQEYESKAPIFNLHQELMDLIKDQTFLHESSKDSSRLLRKDSCKILLNEEKIRKRINKLMPTLLSNLKNEVVSYNQRNNGQTSPLRLNGADFHQEILRIESEQIKAGVRIKQKPKPLSPAKRSVSGAIVESPHLKHPKLEPLASKVRVLKSPTTANTTTITKPTTATAATIGRHNLAGSTSVFKSPNLAGPTSSGFTSDSSTISMVSPINATKTNSRDSHPPVISELRSPLKARREQSLNILRGSPPEKLPKIRKTDNKKHAQTDSLDENQSIYNGQNSSSLIGDEYSNWRQEKIRERNNEYL